ncbi:MAG TPA: hypothetical protein EYG17_04365 [Acidimicrobiia bacterium]|nr:hypothetical protein [Acidimicrobiia bacterium]HIL05269.1 hypothetical protein [Acidimicrobiia bacterium]
MNQVTRNLTYVCVDYEIVGIPQSVEPTELVTEIFEAKGALIVDHETSLVGCFDDAANAVEAAVVAQWRTQREINDPGRKMRIGIHPGDLSQALAVLGCSNGNQIVFSGQIDDVTGGTLDARPMVRAQLWADGEPVQLWLSTDSRPDIDGRPLRLPT